MKILFLTLLYDRQKEKYYLQKAGDLIPNASNTFQYAVIDGFEENNKLDDLYIINSLPFGVYKTQYDELFLKKDDFNYNGQKIGETVPCINIHILKQYSRYINTVKAIKKYIRQYPTEDIMIITYNVYAPYIKACERIVKRYKNVNFCPIITDMPGEFGIIPSELWKRQYLMWLGKQTIKRLTSADRFVFLTEYMKNPLQVKDNYMVMEGIYSTVDKTNQEVDIVPHNKKMILYTGSLNKKFGILDLLDAVLKIDRDDLELYICGSCGNINEVIECAKKHDKIKFLGNVERAEALKYQRSADLLINPRPNNEEFVKYSFPSKTMEYLASGKPILMHKLYGIPNEYDQYLNYFTSDNTVDMAKDIENILYGDYQHYLYKASCGKNFVLQNKTSQKQVGRMLKFFEEDV